MPYSELLRTVAATERPGNVCKLNNLYEPSAVIGQCFYRLFVSF